MVVRPLSSYVPARGDIVWVNYDPVLGHEQGGQRPAVVLSPDSYNRRSSLLIACPITTKIRGYPFEVRLKFKTIDGVALADQLKTIDWQRRKVSFGGKAPASSLKEITAKLSLLIGKD